MTPIRPFLLWLLPVTLTLAGCGGAGLSLGGGGGGSADAPAAAPTPPPVSLNGRWVLSGADGKRCNMNFGSAGASAAEGTIAPEGGCPGKFYMSRKWSYDGSLILRDHKGEALGRLSAQAGGGFQGSATSGESVMLLR